MLFDEVGTQDLTHDGLAVALSRISAGRCVVRRRRLSRGGRLSCWRGWLVMLYGLRGFVVGRWRLIVMRF